VAASLTRRMWAWRDHSLARVFVRGSACELRRVVTVRASQQHKAEAKNANGAMQRGKFSLTRIWIQK
jgi:hypothetical protein